MPASQLARRFFCIFILGCFISSFPASQLARQDPQKAREPVQEPEGTVRITTQLVQIDAVVTDKNGDHVQTLAENDFELTVDGKRQKLTYFSLVKLPEPRAAAAKNTTAAVAPPPSMPGKTIEPEQVQRTIAFVIDDLGLSHESIVYTRRALKKFLDEQMQDGDVIGIVRTGRGHGALQQFTSDKRILYAAVENLSWLPYSRKMIPSFSPQNNEDQLPPEAQEAQQRFNEFNESIFTHGTLGALNFVIRGLRELPGRKSAILISDGFRMFSAGVDNTGVVAAVRRLTDLANRSSVVIYSIDAKGLQTLFPSAADSSGNMTGPQFAAALGRVSRANFESQDGLRFLARETGGLATFNNNDVNFGIQKALHDMQSYYLIGFDPEDEKFDSKYHSIKLTVKRSGMSVRTRAGFLGIPDRPGNNAAPQPLGGPEARDRQILAALYSPFGARDLSMQMTSLFYKSDDGGSYVRSIYHIDGSKLTFQDDPAVKGQKKANFEIVSFTFNELGAVVDQIGRSFTINFDEERYKMAINYGFYYANDFQLKRPGSYQLRTVLRDSETGRLGSAGQFIQAPDLSKKRLTLSGLVIEGSPAEPGQEPQAQRSKEVNPSPAVRRFGRTGSIDYGAAIYNAITDPKTGTSQVTMQIEIFHNGKPIFQGEQRPVEQSGEGLEKRVQAQGRLMLTGFPPGEFMLRLIVTDALAKSKYAKAEQWMDFSVK